MCVLLENLHRRPRFETKFFPLSKSYNTINKFENRETFPSACKSEHHASLSYGRFGIAILNIISNLGSELIMKNMETLPYSCGIKNDEHSCRSP